MTQPVDPVASGLAPFVRPLWITWLDHQRTRSLVRHLGVPLHVRDVKGALKRHVGGCVWAVRLLRRERPDLVFLHLSYALLIACVAYKLLRRGRVVLVADCHNKTLKWLAPGPLRPLSAAVKGWLFRRVDIAVVTNAQLVPIAAALAPAVAVLRDPLPVWADAGAGGPPAAPCAPGPHVFFVCSFDRDEPVDAVFGAAARIVRELDLDVVISGNPRRVVVPAEVAREGRIRLPGFMPDPVYQACLSGARAVVVLTRDRDCLVCGAYEGLAAGRPLVLSDTPVLREAFGESAVYAANDADAIARAVAAACPPDPARQERARQRFLGAFQVEWDAFRRQLAACARR